MRMVSEFKGFKIRMLKGFKSECVMPEWAFRRKRKLLFGAMFQNEKFVSKRFRTPSGIGDILLCDHNGTNSVRRT